MKSLLKKWKLFYAVLLIVSLHSYSEQVYNDAFFAGLTPNESVTVSEWADQNRVLTSKASAEPGPWRTARVPYLKEIMDVLSIHHPAQRVCWMKGSQVGASECGANWIGYMMDKAPGPMMVVLPNDRMSERFSRTRITPMIENTQTLRSKIFDAKKKGESDNVLTKEFPGGVLAMVSAKSSANLRMMPCRYIILEEADDYPYDVKGQGDPVQLATARTRTFSSRKKIYMPSSPTIKNHSRVEREYLQSDQRKYYVPCPECQHKQTLKFSQLKYEKDSEGKPNIVYYVCEECGSVIEEHHKTWMLENGEWRSENPGADPKNVGFHLSTLYSPAGWMSWLEIVTLWELAQKDVDLLKVFVNTILGETWEQRGEAPDWERLYRQRESYRQGMVPAGGLFLTAGVDVQKDRLELEVVAWGRNKWSWSVDYVVIPGDTSTPQPYKQLDELLAGTFTHESGLEMPIMRTAIDSGYNTQEVYQYARRHSGTLKVLASKGQDQLQTILGQPKAVELNVAGKRIPRGLKVWPVGVSVLKGELYQYLKQKPPLNPEESYPHGYCHFPQYGEEYFKQLTAEELMPKSNSRGFTSHEWHKKRERNEALDCRVLARAAAASLGYDRMTDGQFTRLENQLTPEKSNQPQSAPAALSPKPRRRGMRSRGIT